jgi:L-lactate dehydrogenase complex protein LldG
MAMSATQVTSGVVEEFERAAVNAAASVERVPRSAEALNNVLLRVTAGSERIVLAEPEELPPELLATFRTDPRIISDPTDDQLSTAQAGITEAFTAIARTGSIGVRLKGMTAAASLLAPLHVALLRAESIVGRPRELFASGAPGLTQDFVFITGPSATADMGPLVRGVHGPHKLHVIIIE